MRRRRIREGKPRLSTYASGDGAIHFVWTDGKTALGRRVLPSVARRHLERSQDTEHLRSAGWRLVDLGSKKYPQLMLVAPVTRINETQIQYGDAVYDLRIVNREYIWKDDDGRVEYGDGSFQLWFYIDGYPNPFEVKNISIRSAIRHFLNHEERLTPSAPPVKVFDKPFDLLATA